MRSYSRVGIGMLIMLFALSAIALTPVLASQDLSPPGEEVFLSARDADNGKPVGVVYTRAEQPTQTAALWQVTCIDAPETYYAVHDEKNGMSDADAMPSTVETFRQEVDRPAGWGLRGETSSMQRIGALR